MTAQLQSQDALLSELAAVVKDPVRFSRGILGHDPWWMQEAIMRSVAANPRTAVKACHASAKTFTAADIALWWVTRWDDGIVITTAPTWTQVEKLLWGEIRKSRGEARIAYPECSMTELKLGDRNYAIGLSTNEGVRFQGFHGGHILVILDEAPGVKPEIWEAIEGARAGGDVRVLALGNPTIIGGPFYDAFTDHRTGWATFTISAFDTPNLADITLEQLLALAPDDPALHIAPRPYLTLRSWVREKFHEWGPGHPLWDARVEGNFPAQSESALIALAWVEAAKQRSGVDDTALPVTAGIDVAGPGEDETVLVIRQDSVVLLEQAWAKADPRGDVLAALAPYGGRFEAVNVDAVGIGYNFATHLRDQELGGQRLPVRFVNVGEKATNPEKFKNLKAEHYWGLRERFRTGDVSGALSDLAVGQLVGIRYEHNARGQVEIESKEDARKRGVKSPDRAEAYMLAFASADPGPVLGSIHATTHAPVRLDRRALP